jgi:hypothetical protein
MTLHDQPWAAAVPAGPPAVDADTAGERWRNALAELAYAERHGSPADEVEQLAKGVIEARVAMFQAGIPGGRALPASLLPAYLKTITLP